MLLALTWSKLFYLSFFPSQKFYFSDNHSILVQITYVLVLAKGLLYKVINLLSWFIWVVNSTANTVTPRAFSKRSKSKLSHHGSFAGTSITYISTVDQEHSPWMAKFHNYWVFLPSIKRNLILALSWFWEPVFVVALCHYWKLFPTLKWKTYIFVRNGLKIRNKSEVSLSYFFIGLNLLDFFKIKFIYKS